MPAPKITVAYLEKLIKNGYGQGIGLDYKPWIPIKRWNPSKISTQTVGNLPNQHKRASFLSRNEWYLALVIVWLGLRVEIREQYPLWPWDHFHPLSVYENHEHLELCRGIMNICRECGIDHGRFIGTRIPYIWTGDLMVTIINEDSANYRAVLVSGKSVEDHRFIDLDPLDRQLEKLEIERRYASENKLGYFISGAVSFERNFLNNLNLFYTAAHLPVSDRRFGYLQTFIERHGDVATEYPIEEWRRWIMGDSKATLLDAVYVVHHILWHQLVDVDLTVLIRDDHVLKPGGRALRSRICSSLLQDVA